MTQHNTLNVKLSNSQLNKLKSGINNGTVTSKLSSNVAGDSNDEDNFPHKLLLTNHKFWGFVIFLQVIPQLIKNYRKLKLLEIGQSGGFLGRLLGPLLTTGLPLMKNKLKPLAF